VTREAVEEYVWQNSGFSYRGDGVYVVDFGWEWRVAGYDETWWQSQSGYGWRQAREVPDTLSEVDADG
jgi:hypothetical protein